MCLSLQILPSIIRTGNFILVELIDLLNSIRIFLSQITLPRCLTFVLGSLTAPHSRTLLGLFLSSDTSISLQTNSDYVVVSVSIDISSNSKRDVPFHRIVYDYSRADWDGLRDHLRDVPWEDIFKLSASAAAIEFCEWVQVGIDVYIHHRKDQVKPHSSP